MPPGGIEPPHTVREPLRPIGVPKSGKSLPNRRRHSLTRFDAVSASPYGGWGRVCDPAWHEGGTPQPIGWRASRNQEICRKSRGDVCDPAWWEVRTDMRSRFSEPDAPVRGDGPPPPPESFTRVTLRPIAGPLTLGFGALAVATVVVAALQLGWIPISETASVALILLVAVAPAQLLTSILGYLARDGVAGAGMGTLAGTWAAMGLILLTSDPGSTGRAPGLLLLVAGVVMLIPAAGAAMGKLVPAVVLATTSIRFVLTGIWELTGGNDWKIASAIVG